MKAIILAAGKGTRLRPLTNSIPKPLLPIAGVPTIEYAVNNFPEADEIVIAVRDKNDLIKKYFEKNNTEIPINIVDVLGWETGGDLKIAAYEAGINETFAVCYGDVLTEINMNDMTDFHKANKKKVTMSLFPVPEYEKNRFGIAELDGSVIKNFVEKPKDAINSNLANAGYYIMEPSVLDMIPYGHVRTEDIIVPELVKEGEISGYVINPKYWLDIGTIESYNQANKMILDKKGILPPPNKL